jgi:hypothetical protein
LRRFGALAARLEAVGWVYILIPLKLVVRIWKLAVVTIQGRHCRPCKNSTGHLTEKVITFFTELRLQWSWTFQKACFKGYPTLC